MVKIPKLKMPKAKPTPKPKTSSGGMFEGGLGEAMLEGFLRGFTNNYDIDEPSAPIVPKTLGLAGEAMGKGMVVVGAELPVLDTPSRILPVSNPSISSIVKQLDSLVAIAERISLTLKMQQDTLVATNAQNQRAAKEQQMEAGFSQSEITPSSGTGLYETAANMLMVLANTTKKLDQVIQIKASEIGSSSLPFGTSPRGKGPLSPNLRMAPIQQAAPPSFANPTAFPSSSVAPIQQAAPLSFANPTAFPSSSVTPTMSFIQGMAPQTSSVQPTTLPFLSMGMTTAGLYLLPTSEESAAPSTASTTVKDIQQLAKPLVGPVVADIPKPNNPAEVKKVENIITQQISREIYKIMYGTKEISPEKMKKIVSSVRVLVVDALQTTPQAQTPLATSSLLMDSITPTSSQNNQKEIPGGKGIIPGGGGKGRTPIVEGASIAGPSSQVREGSLSPFGMPDSKTEATSIGPKANMGANLQKAQEETKAAARSVQVMMSPSDQPSNPSMLATGTGRIGVGRVPDPTAPETSKYSSQLYFGAAA